jgi:hypothetical protein
MLPNRFPDAGEVPEYNTVDVTLWLIVPPARFDRDNVELAHDPQRYQVMFLQSECAQCPLDRKDLKWILYS